MTKTVIAGLVALLWSALASADGLQCITKADAGNACYVCEICRDHAAVSSCSDGLGDETVLKVQSYAFVRLSALGSTGTFTANIRTSMNGHDTGGAGTELFTDVSTADGAGMVEGTFGYLWGEVDTCVACAVDLSILVCPR